MMTRQEYLLICLAEECDEVGQRVMKALRFGLDEIQSGQSLTNSQRIIEEIRDLLSVASILADMRVIGGYQPTLEEKQAKLAKIEKFMAISREQGVIK